MEFRRILILAVVGLCISFEGLSQGENSLENAFNKKHLENIASLPSNLADYIQVHHPAQKLMNHCRGSFTAESEPRLAIALYDIELGLTSYELLVMKSARIVNRIKVKSNEVSKELGIESEVQCKSALQVEQANELFSTLEAVHGRIESTTELDTLCISGPDSTSFECYEYDQEKREFIRVGGWVT
jgi:hypothetical protein